LKSKSTVLNALVGRPLLPVTITPTNNTDASSMTLASSATGMPKTRRDCRIATVLVSPWSGAFKPAQGSRRPASGQTAELTRMAG
jgi:hypothetical protein